MYFPKISVSILILSPTFFDWKLVILIVWGIKQTEALFFVTSTTVRLIPSIAIDPFLTTNFTNFFGTSNHTLISLGFLADFFYFAYALNYSSEHRLINLILYKKYQFVLKIFTLQDSSEECIGFWYKTYGKDPLWRC